MKKNLIFLISFGVFAILFLNGFSGRIIQTNTFIGGTNLSGQTLEEARNVLARKEKTGKIQIRAGKYLKEIPFKKLGLVIDMQKTLAQIPTDYRYGLSSVASLFDQDKTRLKAEVKIDPDKVKTAILQAFPWLSTPEESHASFFVLSPDQKTKPTFNFRKLIAHLVTQAEEFGEGEVEIDVIPEEAIPEPPSIPELPKEDLELQKKELGKKTFIIHADGEDIQKQEWKIHLKDEGWLTESPYGVSLNESRLREFLSQEVIPKIERPVEHAYIKDFVDEGKAARAAVEGVAHDGIVVPVEQNAQNILKAVSLGIFDIELIVEREQSYVINHTGLDLGGMDLLGVGRSNFAGSPDGRIANVQKGLKENMNNIIVPPGADFSFNSFIGSLSPRDGWKMALGIFGGGTLRPTLGAGLCQVSTTVYRGILNAGLPILKRRPHSLYVKYYKAYGEGLDATIFLGSSGPDLVFMNDTPSYLFIQAYYDGDDGFVKFFGTSDGRKTILNGPYRRTDIPAERNYKPAANEIVWYRTVEWPDGRHADETISSRYRTLPKK